MQATYDIYVYIQTVKQNSKRPVGKILTRKRQTSVEFARGSLGIFLTK